MRLCFGTFAKVLSEHRIYKNKYNTGFTETELVDAIYNCSGRGSAYIDSDKGKNKTIASRLLNCSSPVRFLDESICSIERPLSEIVKQLTETVLPQINPDSYSNILLSLLAIISSDKSIETNSKNSFIKFYGISKHELLQQTDFNLPDFLGRTLMYTMYGDIDNQIKNGAKQKKITLDIIIQLLSPYNLEVEVSPTYDIKLNFVKIINLFKDAFFNFKIDSLIYKTDPSAFITEEALDFCEEFLEYINNNIWAPYAPENGEQLCFTLSKIQEFANTLNDYTTQLGFYLQPVFGEKTIFTPFPGKEKELVSYSLDTRQRLDNLLSDIFAHTLANLCID